jgi:hypothetical protein
VLKTPNTLHESTLEDAEACGVIGGRCIRLNYACRPTIAIGAKRHATLDGDD